MRQLKMQKSITNREAASLDKYLLEIRREGLITPEEEVKLAKKIHAGDLVALEKLVKSNLCFVVSIAKQYQNQGLSLPDMINEGNLGLIKAAGLYDETRGFKFISYAVWWIRQKIMEAISLNSKIVRLPRSKIDDIIKLNKISSKLEQEFERTPTIEEISLVAEMIHGHVVDAIDHDQKDKSLDRQLGFENSGSDTMLGMITNENSPQPDEILMNESLRKELERSLSTLSARASDTLKLFFGLNGNPDGISLEEIAEKLKITRERVRQIKKKAIKMLRVKQRSRLLKACY